MRRYLLTAVCLIALLATSVQADNLICPNAEGDNLGKVGASFGTIYATGVASNLVFTNGITINGDVDITADVAGEEIAIRQTAVAGTADVPFIRIDDERTGTTANTPGEATIVIDAQGSYGLAVTSGIVAIQAEIDCVGDMTLDPAGNDLVVDATIDATALTVDAAAGVDTKTAGTLKLGEATANKVEISATAVNVDVEGPLYAKEDILSDEVDSENAAALILGKSTATSVEIADSGVTTDIQGPVTVLGGIDTAGAAALVLGAATATSVEVGASDAPVDLQGAVTVLGSVDTAAGATLALGSNTATKVEIAKTAITTDIEGPLVAKEDIDSDELDTETATALLLGKATATSVEIADASVPTDIQGPVTVALSIDTAAGNTLALGSNTATKVEIAKTAITTDIEGPLVAKEDITSDELDSETATALLLGKSTATSVEIADSGVNTDIQGPITVALSLDTAAGNTLALGSNTATKVELADTSVETEVQGTLDVHEAANFASTLYHTSQTGTKTRTGTAITIMFLPTTGETLTYTVPTGYDLLVLNAVGWKTAAAAAGGDAWDLKNNDGSAANIFDQEAIGTATLGDKAMAQFDNLDDAEYEVEAGDTLDLVATEDTDDNGADGIIYVTGILKTAD
jgi:hypothetical protein